MLADVKAGEAERAKLGYLFVQGTRVRPRCPCPIRRALPRCTSRFEPALHPRCYRTRYFWPRRGCTGDRVIAVVEFLTPIGAGAGAGQFMEILEKNGRGHGQTALLSEAGLQGISADIWRCNTDRAQYN